jgi:hypothetical protein
LRVEFLLQSNNEPNFPRRQLISGKSNESEGGSNFLRRPVPQEPMKIARHFNAGIGRENIKSRRDG